VQLLFVVDTLLYMFIVWYVSSVFPVGDGLRQHPLFFVQVDLD